jgi:molybdopterin-guanine dinucleotide biosynthesis protein A
MKNVQTPLVGVLTGFEASSAEYSLLLPCDVPFVSKDVLALLFDLCVGRVAAIPRWPNSHIEPLQAVYRTKPASEAAREALDEREFNMRAMIEKLRGIRYISTLVLQQLDPQLETFFNVNTSMNLRRAEQMLKRMSAGTADS